MSSDADELIRAARAALDDALRRRDLDAVAALLLPSYHVVTARSMQRDGREASLRSWEAMFERDGSASQVRTPETIVVNGEWGMAQEHGRWVGIVRTNDGPMEIRGVYAAKWHDTPDGWRLQAEIFTPLTIIRGAPDATAVASPSAAT